MKRFLLLPSVLVCTVLSTAICWAGEPFTDVVAWENAICGTVVSDNFGALETPSSGPLASNPGFVGLIGLPQTLTWGDVNTDATGGGILAVESAGISSIVGAETEKTSLVPNSALGPFEGFCFRYSGAALDVMIFDGTTMVDSFTTALGQQAETDPETFFGWLNTDGLNVTHIELDVVDNNPTLGEVTALNTGQFSFAPTCDPDPTCRDLLDGIIDDVTAIPSTGNCWDDYYISWALANLSSANDDAYWQDGGDLLSNAGCRVFRRAKRATRYLIWASNTPEILAAIDSIQEFTACLVEKEIEAATDAGGDAAAIAAAIDYQTLADNYEAAGHPKFAIRLRKFAWLCARYAY